MLSNLNRNSVINNNSNNLIVPLGFCKIHDSVYRSSYPATKSLPFISTLGLKSIICLTPSELKKELRDYCEKNSITIFEANVGYNQEPFVLMSESAVSEAIHFALDLAQRPSLIFCTSGKVKTSCVVACLRKHSPSRWSTVSAIAGNTLFNTFCLLYIYFILLEFEQFSDDGGLADLHFLDNFKCTICQ